MENMKKKGVLAAVIVALVIAMVLAVSACSNPFATAVSQSDADAAVSDADVSDADAEPVVDDREVLISCISEDELFSVGDIITYGTYEQDGDTKNGAEPIEWRILAIEDDRVLVISEYGLDCKPFNEKRVDITWADSTLRQWLNKDFYNKAFSKDEKANILTVTLENPINSMYGTGGEPDTEDTIFVLSLDEKEKYFPDFKTAGCYPTQFALDNGAKLSKNPDATGMCERYWLRTIGMEPINVVIIMHNGFNTESGGLCNDDYVAVRPAMYLSL